MNEFEDVGSSSSATFVTKIYESVVDTNTFKMIEILVEFTKIARHLKSNFGCVRNLHIHAPYL